MKLFGKQHRSKNEFQIRGVASTRLSLAQLLIMVPVSYGARKEEVKQDRVTGVLLV